MNKCQDCGTETAVIFQGSTKRLCGDCLEEFIAKENAKMPVTPLPTSREVENSLKYKTERYINK